MAFGLAIALSPPVFLFLWAYVAGGFEPYSDQTFRVECYTNSANAGILQVSGRLVPTSSALRLLAANAILGPAVVVEKASLPNN